MTWSPRAASDDYAWVLADAIAAIHAARTRAVLAVNSELIGLYWKLGQMIPERQETEGWGAKPLSNGKAQARRSRSEPAGPFPTRSWTN